MIFFIPRTKNQLILFLVIGSLIIGAYYYEDSKLRNFNNTNELRAFLTQDDTDQYRWSEDFTCEDFTNMLIENAKTDGYRLNYVSVDDPNSLWPNEDFYWVGEGGHALCLAYIENSETWVCVEPQNDHILPNNTGQEPSLFTLNDIYHYIDKLFSIRLDDIISKLNIES